MAKKKNQLMIATLLVLLCTTVLYCGCTGTSTQHVQTEKTTKTITDMTGREIEIPQKINRVLTTVPMTTIAVYALAPEKLIGINLDPNKVGGNVYIPDEYHALPNVGGWFGNQTGNYEVFISLNPDLIIDGEG
ncbi:MAG: iron ABC transporter substrate-binding protein, partial [Methanoregulaceae archaeon]